MIKQMKLQSPSIRNISLKNLKNNAFCLLPENMIYAMLCDNDPEVRALALNKIIAIRESGSNSRINKIMEINYDAECYWELIDIDYPGIGEPAYTAKFLKSELEEMMQTQSKQELPVHPSHSRSVVWTVKLVSDPSQRVYGKAHCHLHILGKVRSRKLRKSFSSKKYYKENYEEIL